MEPRPSRRADGRGWSGRGDSAAGRGDAGGERPHPATGRGETGAGPADDQDAGGDVARLEIGHGLSGSDPDESTDDHAARRHERFEQARTQVEAEARRAAEAFHRAEIPDEDLLRGPGDTPWVRMEGDPGPPPGARSGAPGRPPMPDFSALLVVLEGLRAMVPTDLTHQFNALVREILLTLRALIDWYLERLDGGPQQPEVEDIPID